MSSLFNITSDLVRLRNLLEAETEFDIANPELEESLVIKQEQLAGKMEGYVHVMNNADAQIEMAKAEIARINKFIAVKQHMRDRLEAALLQALLLFGEDDKGVRRLQIGTLRLSTRKSTSIQVNVEPDQVPDSCKYITATFKKLTPEMAKFLQRRLHDLPDSIGKKALLEAYTEIIDVSKTLVKEELKLHPVVAPEMKGELDPDAPLFVPWAEEVTKYGLTIK